MFTPQVYFADWNWRDYSWTVIASAIAVYGFIAWRKMTKEKGLLT